MKAKLLLTLSLAAVLAANLGCAEEPPRMKMTTSIPHGITTADSVETRLGTLKFTDGFPDDATVEKVLENLDFQRGVQAVLRAIPAASLHAMREGLRTFGPTTRTQLYLSR